MSKNESEISSNLLSTSDRLYNAEYAYANYMLCVRSNNFFRRRLLGA